MTGSITYTTTTTYTTTDFGKPADAIWRGGDFTRYDITLPSTRFLSLYDAPELKIARSTEVWTNVEHPKIGPVRPSLAKKYFLCSA
ncbi:hypothetical protein Q5691_11470 [Microcoleus sp. w1-18aA5]|uniref:hypothetical protein n=1 Tax=Microcoleus sp. w1-18aA5 TaxID=2818982 RepID=UPI002FD2B74C